MNTVKGFLKAQGQKIVNENGQPFLFKGVGLGGWLLPEGYMWHFPDQGDRPRRIEKMIEELIGREKAKWFWEIYVDRYISEEDICRIVDEGFNSVRIPINSRFLLDERKPFHYNEHHLQLIDRMIGWCKDNHLYVILDLHGAPGGQTGTHIDDSENDRPELFTNDENKQQTIALWRMLAERYKDEWIIAGYDLLNEPLVKWFSIYNDQLLPLYREIVKAIREVDKKHMIILEGVDWSTDWSIFTDKMDENMILQFHKYWNNPDPESLEAYLKKGEEWNIPIMMGEGGENNKNWYVGTFSLLDDFDISWIFWTWKKMKTDNSPCSINMPEQWQVLVDYLKGGVRPDEETVEYILDEYLDNISLERCVYLPEVANSIFRRPPVRIPAAFYGFKGKDVSFGIANRSDRHIEFRIHDGTDIRFMESSRLMPNFQQMSGESWKIDERICIHLAAEDWLAYEITAEPTLELPFFILDLYLRVPNESARIIVFVDDTRIGALDVGKRSWERIRLKEKFQMNPGMHRIVLKAEKNPILIEWLEIIPIIKEESN